MPSLTAARDAARELLRVGLPGVGRIEAFAGDMDLSALSLQGVAPGASIFVAALGATNVGLGLDFDMLGSFAAFCLVRKAKREIRDKDALAVAEQVAMMLHGETFGLPGLTPAKVVALTPLEDDDIAKAGVVIWAVAWEQNLVFDV